MIKIPESCSENFEKINHEALKNDVFKLVTSRKFVPAGRTLSLAGTNNKLIPNCLVLDIDDSLMGIFHTLERAAICQQSGMGIGFNFSTLRPCWERTHNGCQSSGPLSFMNMYSSSLKIIQQKSRGGANMGILNIDHPDILSFIHIKDNLSLLSNFNISVFITKEFMEGLSSTPDEYFMCQFNGTFYKPRRLIYDNECVIHEIKEEDITYQQIWDEIIHCAWSTGEPGVVFDYNINKSNKLFKYLGKIQCTNPCSEVPLYPNETCNLGSVNLEEFCDEISLNDAFWLNYKNNVYSEVNSVKASIKLMKAAKKLIFSRIHVEELKHCVTCAVKYLNIIIDNLQIPDQNIAIFVPILRRIGLGVMGLHDMFIKLKIEYGSELSFKVAKSILKLIEKEAQATSKSLVGEYGSIAERLLKYKDIGLYELNNLDELLQDEYLNTHANIELTSIAPTGSISMITNVSSGIEPYFDLTYRRRVSKQLVKDVVINKHLKRYLMENGIFDDEHLGKIMEFGIKQCTFIDKRMRRVFKTAQRIKPIKHTKMQSSIQRYTGNAISKTCNLPNCATPDDVNNVFMSAYISGCKGVTVYRDGSRQFQVFSTVTATTTEAAENGHEASNIEFQPGIITTEDATIKEETSKILGRTCKNGTCEI
jgi:ribonucleoside-diphosphate reductase alpha chain